MVKKGGLMFQSAAKHEGTSAFFLNMSGFIRNVWFLSDISDRKVVQFFIDLAKRKGLKVAFWGKNL